MKNQETKELLSGLLAIAELLAVEFKDGIQAADFADVLVKLESNDELKARLLAAYNGIDMVPAEVNKLTVLDTLDILSAVMPDMVRLIGAIKK